MVDAMFIAKPILLYSFADKETIRLNQHPLITTGATSLFSSTQELLSLMDKIKQKQFVKNMLAGQKEFLRSYCSTNGKPATDRLFNLVNNQLDE